MPWESSSSKKGAGTGGLGEQFSARVSAWYPQTLATSQTPKGDKGKMGRRREKYGERLVTKEGGRNDR